MDAASRPQAGTGGTDRLESFNPATGALLGSVGTLTPEQVQAIVDDVTRVQPAWADLGLRTRASYMRRAADALLDEIDELAELLASEQGKPRAEAYAMELLPTIDALHWCAEAGPEILADERIRFSQPFLLSKRSHFAFEPLGVVGVIAPWNYPWSIPFGEVAIALMAGNGVVLKPASLTPLLGDRIRGVFERAGFPDGLVQTVHGGGRIGDALVRSSAGKIFFTGSVEVGRKVGESCAQQLKGSVLELGGKDPMIVCADADLDNAVSGAIWGGFANAGQTCSGIERVYVVREVAERFVAAVAREAGGLRVGDPLDWDTQIGPMTSADQHEIRLRAGRRRPRLGRRAALRGAGDGARAGGEVHLAHRPGERHPRDADHARGDLRPGVADRRGRGRGRGDRPRQRLGVRPRRFRVDQGPPEGRADLQADRLGDGLDQRPLIHPRRLPVLLGRREELGSGPLALEVRLLRVLRGQARHLGAGDDPRPLVVPVRPRPRPTRCAPLPGCSTGGTAGGPRPCARASARCSGSGRERCARAAS